MNAQYILLGFLAEGSNYGYELKKKYDGYFGKDKPILAGQVYSTLARLKRDNKVKEVADTSESGGPDRVRYEITEQGGTTSLAGSARSADAATASHYVHQNCTGDAQRWRRCTVSGQSTLGAHPANARVNDAAAR